MNDTIAQSVASKDPGADREDGAEPEVFKPWSREEAEAWRRSNPPVSPWRVVAVQAVAGLLCCAAVWAITRRGEAAWSALYGAAAVVVPSALLARGMTRDLTGMTGAAGVAMFRFMFWEAIKIGVSVAMLVAAPRVVQGLSWPALLVAMIVCMKMNWLGLLWRPRSGTTNTTQRV